MAQVSPKLKFYDEEKIKRINPETIKLWNKYKIDMELRELGARTQQQYYNDLLHWWIFILDNQDNRCVTELTEEDLTYFFYFCKKGGNSSRRMRRRMASVSAFYKFLRKKKLITDNPMEFIDRPTKDTDVAVQTFLTKDQVNLMRDVLREQVEGAATEHQKHTWMTIQCYAFFSLSTMARVTAVSNTRWDQIDFESRVVSDVVEKEGYIVDLYFSDEVKSYLLALKQYREEHGINDGGYVFAAYSSGVYNKAVVGTLNQWCKRIGELINVPTLHPHDFRHSGATLLKNSGMDLEDVSKLLNHKGTDVTSKYYIKEDKKLIQSAKDRFEAF